MDRLLKTGIFASVALIFFIKAPNLYLRPPLLYEDGRDLFSYYFNHRDPSAVFRSYNGYMSLVPNLLGYLAYWEPVRWIPRSYSFCALFFNTFAFSLFSRNRFRAIVPSDTARAGACLFLAAMPLGDYAVLTSAMYLLWPLLLVLLLMLLVPFGGSATSRLAIVGGLSLCIASNPLCVVAIPLLIFNCVRHVDWRERLMNVALLGVTAVYLFFGTQPSAPGDVFAGLRATLAVGLERVYLESAVGAMRRFAWHGNGYATWVNRCLGASCLAGLSLMLVAARAQVDRKLLQSVLILNYLVWAVTLTSALSRGWDENTLLQHYLPKRYTFVPEFCWLLALSATVGRVGPCFIATRQRRLLGLAAVMLYAAILSSENRPLWRYDELGQAGNEVRGFMCQVERAKNAPSNLRPIELALEREVWSVRIVVR